MKLYLPIVLILSLSLIGCSATSPKLYPDKQQAVKELKTAIENHDRDMAAKVLGADAEFYFDSGDTELDKSRARIFTEKFNEFHDLEKKENDQYFLVLGKKRWPFPAPLVEENGEWFFDTESGKEIIQDRLIGANELSAISVLETIYYAQQDFFNLDLDKNGIADYAKKIRSSEGQTDGLYWSVTSSDQTPSPLAELFAQAAEQGYNIDNKAAKPRPYRGYYFKILESDNNKFWVIAHPAVWGNSGYMSFAINEKAWVFEKNLGSDFDPESVKVDQSWGRIQ